MCIFCTFLGVSLKFFRSKFYLNISKFGTNILHYYSHPNDQITQPNNMFYLERYILTNIILQKYGLTNYK